MSVYKKFLVYLFATTFIGVFYLRIFHYTFIYEKPIEIVTGCGKVCLVSLVLYIIVGLVQKKVLKPFIVYTEKAMREKRDLTQTEIEACMKSYKNFDIGVAVTEAAGFILGSGYSVISESLSAPEPFSIILIIQIIMQSVGFGFLNFVIIVFCVKRIEMTKILRKVGVRNIKNSLSSILSATIICIIYMCIMNMTLVSEGLILNPRPDPMKTYGLYATIGAVLTVLGCWIMYRLLIKRMQNNEAEVSRILHEETQNLAIATKQSASTSQDQNAAVKEIVATMQGNSELNDNIDKKVRNVNEHAEKSKNDVIAGVSALEENVQGLLEIMECNKSTIEGIKNLGVKIERVWDIVSLINDIADTAKIIAFNAELEASSAGESGKNFHIVATEVRRLSDNIIDGTHEIKEKIEEIQKASDTLILASEKGTMKIEDGYNRAKILESKFESIKNSSEVTAESSKDIISYIQQLSNASEQIFITLKQIAHGIESFSQATENISCSSEKVRTIASEL